MHLSALKSQLTALPPDTPLRFATDDGAAGPGYHITELKHAQISSIDCAARQDAWSEAIVQVMDGQSGRPMTVGRAAGILGKALTAVPGLGDAPLRVEFAHANAGLHLHDPIAPRLVDGEAVIALQPVAAQCKPAKAFERQSGTTCCG